MKLPRATRLKAYREAHADDEPELPVSERARLRELERRTRELEMENAFLKKVPMTARGLAVTAAV